MVSKMNRIRIPIRKLRKSDIVWLAEHYCRHHHSYLAHYACFLREQPDTSPLQEKIGIFDIETTGLKASYSHMLSWCMKKHNQEIIHCDLLTSLEVRDKNDERIVKSAVNEIKKYDRIVGHYSMRFDIPYVRSRALYHGIDFPGYRELYHSDTYFLARMKFAIHSNRLGALCQFFGIEAKSHPMTPDLWRRAGAGKKEALETVLTHCQEDVTSTDKLFSLLLKHTMLAKRSI